MGLIPQESWHASMDNLKQVLEKTLRQENPKLFAAISREIDARKSARGDEVAKALKRALRESPPPTPRDFARRSGHDLAWIKATLPDLVAQLKAQRDKELETPLTAQHRKKLKDLLPRAHSMTLKELERQMGLSASYMIRKLPREYRALAECLRKPKQERDAERRKRLLGFVTKFVRDRAKDGYSPTMREIRAALPEGLPKSLHNLNDAVRAAREGLEKRARRPGGRSRK